MTRTSTVPLAALMLVGLLVAAPLVATVAVDGAAATAANQAASPSSASEYSLEELKRDGARQNVDSVRMANTDDLMYWLVYWPANDVFASPGGDEGGQYLPPNQTVGRDTVYLRTWAFSDREETVHMVFWNEKTRTVERGNTTVAEPYAANVNEVTREVTVDRGRPTVAIDMPNHQSQKRVTMWIEGKDWARWTFRHKSLATTQAVNIDSAGDYLASVISDFLVWIIIGGFLVGWVCKVAIDRAGDGPGYGLAPWVIGLSLATGLGSLMFYESVASLVVNAHIVLSAYVVGIIAIIMLEMRSTGVSKAMFLQPKLTHAESPTGDDAFDMLDAELEDARIVRGTDGTVSVVTRGLLPFLARAFGAKARLYNAEKLRTRVNLQNSKWDELFVADPEADEILHYEPEGWKLETPPLDREHVGTYGAIALAFVVGGLGIQFGSVSPWLVIGALGAGLLAWAAETVNGEAFVEPAPVHIRTAVASMFALAEDVDDAKTLDDARDQIDKLRVQKQRKIDEEVEDHDRTLLEEMMDPDEEIPAPTARSDDEDSEVVDRRRESGEGARSEGGVPSDDD
ncbi:hypothetical protein C475_14493 [Halosimplex carlsbadense 2-9-1]|uniref:Uncharacterized protein n=1 Tax=Halosimplex carlsbadense 2-9-1 TaxID=797114 RepID=M0CJP2_9EURY|nr:hypothetical protein [Halosimplex carlsbadense]ELZ23490.1 hypothetical protein C475_14493 [Halosimplex carlsbadense 2-9-1]